MGRFALVTSAIVEAELEPASAEVRGFFDQFFDLAEVIEINEEALRLQQRYIDNGVVTAKSTNDAPHVGVAVISECDLIISWNFKHIVHFDKIPKHNAINVLNGYGEIGIYSPLEVIGYDDP